MEVQKNVSLKAYHTFGVEVFANEFVEVDTIEKLKEVFAKQPGSFLILGGGSNLLFTQNYEGLVIKNNLKGIEVIDEDDDTIQLKVGAGENWHDFVLYCVAEGYGGIENMSLIPGNVGASPMQNIGAYGVEVKQVITEVEVLKIDDLSIRKFTNTACEFDYRSSIFKTREKGNYVITAVTYRLSKKPQINTSYGAIAHELKDMGKSAPSIKDVSDAVIAIRQRKLPDPSKIGNAGSFFKNPIVSKDKKEALTKEYPNIPNYGYKHDTFKIAAGWLIEQCGWKGKRIENHGVHVNQALVLVNYGGASGDAIYSLSEAIITSVKQKFGIELEREVNIIG